MPLPGGGVAYYAGNQLVAFSRNGETLWQTQLDGRIFDWELGTDLLYISTAGTEGQTWAFSAAGPVGEEADISGYPLPVADYVAVYAAVGLYRMAPGMGVMEALVELPTAYLVTGDAITLPDGGLLLAHRDLYDRRLIALNSDGSLRWERSLRSIPSTAQELVVVDGRVYLVNEYFAQTGGEVTIYAVNLDEPGLTKILDLPTRPVIGGALWSTAVNDRYILLGIDQYLLLFDPLLAAEQLAGGG
jgi:outer membrane protein assembly factor BamB